MNRRPASLPAGLSLPRSAGARPGQRPHHLIDTEARWRLSRRKLLERLNEASDRRLGGHKQEHPFYEPLVIGVRRYVGSLKGICSEIEQFGNTQTGERL